MIETILNVVYDTNNAQSFGTVESGYPLSDNRWYQETLFRNKSGYWFLYGEGGSQTRFATERTGGERTGSRGIIPIGQMQAMHWLARIGHVDALRELFAGEKRYLENEYRLQF